MDKDFDYTIVEPPKDPQLTPAPYEGDDEMLKHEGGGHDQKTHGNWATGGEISNWNPKDPIPESPRNAGGMTAKAWEAWEHGPDGQNFIALFRKYAAQELGLEVPKTPFDPGEYLNYMMDRGWGKPSREEAKGMLNAIANGKPQPALYRGMTDSTDPEEQKSFDALLSTKPGDTFDMPLVSTTRSVGVATWYAADVAGVGERSVVMKIQDGAKGVSLKKENSVYPQDHEVITSGKFEVVSVSKVSIPYWSRGIFEPRKVDYKPEYGGTRYEVATYSKKTYSEAEAKIAYDAVQSGNLSSLETPDFKLTDDRASKGSLSSWTREPAKEFTVIEVKMVEPHTVQKAKDYGNEFFFLFNNMPFIHDDPEDVQKHGSHDQKTHGSWADASSLPEGIGYSEKDPHPKYESEAGPYLEGYTSVFYSSLNNHLRGKPQADEDYAIDSEELVDYISSIDSIIAETSAPRDMLLYRGTSGVNKFDTLKEGDVFADKGYVSTTTKTDQLWNFMSTATGGRFDSRPVEKGYVLQINVPKGSNVLSVNRYFKGVSESYGPTAGIREENEHLLPRGTKFRVDSIGSIDVREGIKDKLIKVTVVNDG